jgi:iron complex outermembrane receptor protein
MPCTFSAHVERCGISVSSEFAQSRQQLTDPAYELGYGATHIDNVARSYTQRIRVEHRATDKLSLGWLLSARASNVSLWEDQAAALNAQRITVIPGFDAEYAASERTLFNLVARSQVARTKADSNQSNSTPLATGRVGTRFLLSDNLSVFANVGRYYRSPTLAELYGTGPQIRGNAELLPESGFGEDLGVTYQQLGSFYQLSASASAYHQELKELVAWQRSSFGQIRPYNVGSARLLGSDFYLGLALWDSLRVDSSLSLLEPRDTEDNRPYKNDLLPYRSRLVQNSMLTVSLPKHLRPRFIRSVSSWLVHQQRSNRYAVRAGNVVLPATSTTDVGVAMGLPLIPVTLRGQVANLFASQNYDLVGMPLPQRNWAISAEFDFTVTP